LTRISRMKWKIEKALEKLCLRGNSDIRAGHGCLMPSSDQLVRSLVGQHASLWGAVHKLAQWVGSVYPGGSRPSLQEKYICNALMWGRACVYLWKSDSVFKPLKTWWQTKPVGVYSKFNMFEGFFSPIETGWTCDFSRGHKFLRVEIEDILLFFTLCNGHPCRPLTPTFSCKCRRMENPECGPDVDRRLAWRRWELSLTDYSVW